MARWVPASLCLLVAVEAWAAPPRLELQAAARREVALMAGAVVSWPVHRLRPAMIRGLAEATRGSDDESRARSFLQAHPALFGGEGSSLAVRDVQSTADRRVVRFDQRYHGLPVFGAGVSVVLDQSDRVRAVSSEMEPLRLPSIQPGISQGAAVGAVCARLDREIPTLFNARLGILAEGTPRLVYRVALPPTVDPEIRWHLVDALSGEYVGWRRAAPAGGR